MSCRVLKRDMELAMLDKLVETALERGAKKLVGRYIRSAKNDMVAEHYRNLGFRCVSSSPDGSETLWELALDELHYRPRSRYIKDHALGPRSSAGKN